MTSQDTQQLRYLRGVWGRIGRGVERAALRALGLGAGLLAGRAHGGGGLRAVATRCPPPAATRRPSSTDGASVCTLSVVSRQLFTM